MNPMENSTVLAMLAAVRGPTERFESVIHALGQITEIISQEVSAATTNTKRKTVSPTMWWAFQLLERTPQYASSRACMYHHIEAWIAHPANQTKKRVDDMLLALNPVVVAFSTNASYENNTRSTIRTIINKYIHVDNPEFAISMEKKRKLNASHYKAVVKQNQEPLVFGIGAIHKIKDALIASYELMDKILLVQLCTGSRFVEVLKISTYTVSSNNQITITHTAKTKDTVVITKPCLYVPPATIVDMIQTQIRPEVDAIMRVSKNVTLSSAKNALLTSTFNKRANDRLRHMFGLYSTTNPHGTHTMRKLYANISYDVSNKTMTRNAWIQRVLGHSPESLTTSLSYVGTLITWDNAAQRQQYHK